VDIGGQNIQATMEALACRETAEYIVQHPELYKAHQIMAPDGKEYANANDVVNWALDRSPTNGMALEFGVGHGRTFKLTAKRRYIHGFDSFKGLPEAWRSGLPKGTFSNAGLSLPAIQKYVDDGKGRLWHGLFEDTIPEFVQEYGVQLADRGIDYLHVDSDLYSSAVTVLTSLAEFLKPGSIILFDEYWNFPGWQLDGRGEHAALMEWDHVGWEYLAYNPVGQEVVVRMKRNRDK
jgi:hypothetical protein